MSCSTWIQQADPLHVKNPHIRNSLNTLFCVKIRLARNVTESVVLPSWAVTDRHSYSEDGLWVEMQDFDWLIVSSWRRILTAGLTIFSGHRLTETWKQVLSEPRNLIVTALLFTLPCVPVHLVLSLATAAFTRRLLVHQTAGEIVDEWIEAAVGTG